MFQRNRGLTFLVLTLCIFFVPYLAFSAEKKVVRIWHT